MSRSGILTVDRGPLFDDSITHFECHTHAPYASTRYRNNDEIRIPVQQQDVFTLPAESYRRQTVQKQAATGDLNVKLVNNAMASLFEEIRYELAGVEVDRTKRRHNHDYQESTVDQASRQHVLQKRRMDGFGSVYD